MYRFALFISIGIYVIFVDGSKNNDLHVSSSLVKETIPALASQQRKAGHYFLYPYHGWFALSWIYWIKVKLIIIAFFVGTAFIWATQYIGKFYQHCPSADYVHYG